MILAAALFALAIGWIAGVLAGARHAGALHAENAHLRRALRYVRGIAIQHPELRLRRYLDQVLDDEAGA
jgi:hypothetical protein